MKIIQNENMAFRLPNTLKEKLVAYADENELHVAAVVRNACSRFLKQEAADRSFRIFTDENEWAKAINQRREQGL